MRLGRAMTSTYLFLALGTVMVTVSIFEPDPAKVFPLLGWHFMETGLITIKQSEMKMETGNGFMSMACILAGFTWTITPMLKQHVLQLQQQQSLTHAIWSWEKLQKSQLIMKLHDYEADIS